MTHVGADRLESDRQGSGVRRRAVARREARRVPSPRLSRRRHQGCGAGLLLQHDAHPSCLPASACRASPGLNNVDQFFTDTQLAAAAEPSHGSTKSAGPDAASRVYLLTRALAGTTLATSARCTTSRAPTGTAPAQTIGFTLWGAGEVQAASDGVRHRHRRTGAHRRHAVYRATATARRHRARARPSKSSPTTCSTSSRTATPTTTTPATTRPVSTSRRLTAWRQASPRSTTWATARRPLHRVSPTAQLQRQRRRSRRRDRGRGERPDAALGLQQLGLRRRRRVRGARTRSCSPRRTPSDRGSGRHDVLLLDRATTAPTSRAYPADSPYVVAVGGTSLFSTQSLTSSSPGAATLSTEDTWAAGGSWCSNVEPRPAWQNGRRRDGECRPARAARCRTSRPSPTRTPRSTRSTPQARAVTGTRIGRWHERRRAGDERHGGRHRELRRRPDLSGAARRRSVSRARSCTCSATAATTRATSVTFSAATTPTRAAAPTARPPSPAGTKQPAGERIDWHNYSTGYAIAARRDRPDACLHRSRRTTSGMREDTWQLDRARHLVPDLVCRLRRRDRCEQPMAGSRTYRAGPGERRTPSTRRPTAAPTGCRPTPTCSRSRARAPRTCIEVGDGGVIKRTTNSRCHLDRRYDGIRPGAYPGDVPLEQHLLRGR